MTTNNLIQLLNPPPQDITNDILVRQWMLNTYNYLYAQNVQASNTVEPTPPITLTDVQAAIDTSLGLIETKTLLTTVLANNSIQMDCPTFSTYKNIYIYFQNIIMDTNGAYLKLNYSSDALTTIDTSTIYQYQTRGLSNSTDAFSVSASGTAFPICATPTPTATSTIPISGIINISDVNQVISTISLRGDFSYKANGLTTTIFNIAGEYAPPALATSIRITPSSGLIVSGTVKFYGYN